MLKLPKEAGIYEIVHIPTQRKYVGSTNNFQNRKRGHWQALRRGDHDNSKLQNAWNKYGEEEFDFVILERCTVEELIPKEQTYIDSDKYHYNISKIAGVPQQTPEGLERIRKYNQDKEVNTRYNGRTLRELVLDYGNVVNWDVAYGRVRMGWDPVKAVSTELCPTTILGGPKIYEYKGAMCSLADLEKFSGLPRSLINKRMKRYGYTVEEAVETTRAEAVKRKAAKTSATRRNKNE